MRLNNCKKAQKSLKTKKQQTHKLFHRHSMQDDQEGMGKWQFTIIEQCTSTNAKLWKREVYWQRHLKMFFPNGFNEHEESCLY